MTMLTIYDNVSKWIKSNSKKPETLSFILSFFNSFLSNFPQHYKACTSVPKRQSIKTCSFLSHRNGMISFNSYSNEPSICIGMESHSLPILKKYPTRINGTMQVYPGQMASGHKLVHPYESLSEIIPLVI